MITMTCLIGDCGFPRLPGLGRSFGPCVAAASAGPMDIWIIASDSAVPRRPRSVCETIALTLMVSPRQKLVRPPSGAAAMVGRGVLQTGDALLNATLRFERGCFLVSFAARERAVAIILLHAKSCRPQAVSSAPGTPRFPTSRSR